MKKRKDFYNKIINWADRKGFKNIKANADGFDTPKRFTRSHKPEADPVTPDATATSFGTKSYFEIALKTNNRSLRQRLISKWKLLSLLAQRKGGQLYLFIPHGHKRFTRDIAAKHDIQANFISLSKLKATT